MIFETVLVWLAFIQALTAWYSDVEVASRLLSGMPPQPPQQLMLEPPGIIICVDGVDVVYNEFNGYEELEEGNFGTDSNSTHSNSDASFSSDFTADARPQKVLFTLANITGTSLVTALKIVASESLKFTECLDGTGSNIKIATCLVTSSTNIRHRHHLQAIIWRTEVLDTLIALGDNLQHAIPYMVQVAVLNELFVIAVLCLLFIFIFVYLLLNQFLNLISTLFVCANTFIQNVLPWQSLVCLLCDLCHMGSTIVTTYWRLSLLCIYYGLFELMALEVPIMFFLFVNWFEHGLNALPELVSLEVPIMFFLFVDLFEHGLNALPELVPLEVPIMFFWFVDLFELMTRQVLEKICLFVCGMNALTERVALQVLDLFFLFVELSELMARKVPEIVFFLVELFERMAWGMIALPGKLFYLFDTFAYHMIQVLLVLVIKVLGMCFSFVEGIFFFIAMFQGMLRCCIKDIIAPFTVIFHLLDAFLFDYFAKTRW